MSALRIRLPRWSVPARQTYKQFTSIDGTCALVPITAELDENSHIDPTAKIDSCAILRGRIKIGQGCEISGKTELDATADGEIITIGANTKLHAARLRGIIQLGSRVHIIGGELCGKITLGDEVEAISSTIKGTVRIGSGTVLKTGMQVIPLAGNDTIIGDKVVIEEGAIIGSGATIGDGITVQAFEIVRNHMRITNGSGRYDTSLHY